MTNQEIKNITWKFIRGDMTKSDFESVFYNENNGTILFFGSSLNLEIISNNFKNKDDTFKLKLVLSDFLKNKYPERCRCMEIKDQVVIGMGHEEDKLVNFQTIKQRKEPYSWINLSQCMSCSQEWLIGLELQNDDFYLKRLSQTEAENIKTKNQWPSDFDKIQKQAITPTNKYKKLLMIWIILVFALTALRFFFDF